MYYDIKYSISKEHIFRFRKSSGLLPEINELKERIEKLKNTSPIVSEKIDIPQLLPITEIEREITDEIIRITNKYNTTLSDETTSAVNNNITSNISEITNKINLLCIKIKTDVDRGIDKIFNKDICERIDLLGIFYTNNIHLFETITHHSHIESFSLIISLIIGEKFSLLTEKIPSINQFDNINNILTILKEKNMELKFGVKTSEECTTKFNILLELLNNKYPEELNQNFLELNIENGLKKIKLNLNE